MGYFVNIDTTTHVLLAVLAATLVIGFMLRPGPPLVHPFLLGKQSIPSQSRQVGESAVYLNSLTAGNRAPVRPDRAVKTVWDVVRESHSNFGFGRAGTWVQGGESIKETVLALAAGFESKLGQEGGKVGVVVEDPTDAFVVTIALILSSFTPLVIAPGSSLPSDVELVAIVQSASLFTPAPGLTASPNATHIQLGGDDSSVAEDLLATGKTVIADGKVPEVAEAQPGDVALTIVSDNVALDFTHMNLTASLVSWLSIFPATPVGVRPTSRDTLASFHHPSTPYGFGLALTALYTNASISFPTLPSPVESQAFSSWLFSIPLPARPTFLFAPTAHLEDAVYKSLLRQMLDVGGWSLTRARDGKIAMLREGLLGRETFWDTIMFKHVRTDANLDELKAVVFEGAAPAGQLETIRAVLGVPVITTLGHGLLLGPVSAQGMYDLQRLPPPGVSEKDHTGRDNGPVGPPVPGVEVKLVGVEEEIAGGRVRGELYLRSPMLPRVDSLPESVVVTEASLPALPAYPGAPEGVEQGAKWLKTGIRAEVGTEGALWVQ